MSLESAVERLALAVARQAGNAAVAEIIRERDLARRQQADMTWDRDQEQRMRMGLQQRGAAKDRRIASLRGVITRMKKAKGMA